MSNFKSKNDTKSDTMNSNEKKVKFETKNSSTFSQSDDETSKNKDMLLVNKKAADSYDINYKAFKKKELDESTVIANSKATNEEVWPILRNQQTNSKRIIKNSTSCEVLSEEKVTVV